MREGLVERLQGVRLQLPPPLRLATVHKEPGQEGIDVGTLVKENGVIGVFNPVVRGRGSCLTQFPVQPFAEFDKASPPLAVVGFEHAAFYKDQPAEVPWRQSFPDRFVVRDADAWLGAANPFL